jgi:hypothetical protein
MGPPVQMTMERTGLDDISWPSQIPDHTHVQNHVSNHDAIIEGLC